MDFFKQQFTAEEVQEGKIILIDKPLGWSSFQVVNKVRWHLKNSCRLKKLKVGHAGTLDPLATGLLILCTGKKTKWIPEIQLGEKEYIGTLLLGATTPSFDLETQIDQTYSYDHITHENLYATLPQFIGDIVQQPPLFSAIKKDGKRLYEYARLGETIAIPSRIVHLKKFEITNFELPKVDFLVRCSKGTYIRSLAHDFGKALNSGAHLTALKRTQSGDFKLSNAYSIASILI